MTTLLSSKSKEVLLLCRSQFGYQTDYYYYSTLAAEYFNITMLCLDVGKDYINSKSVNVDYVSNENSRYKRAIKFISAIRRITASKSFDVIIVQYFKGCWLIPFLLFRIRHRLILDIRTGDVSSNYFKFTLNNFLLRISAFLYPSLSIVSLKLAVYLKLPLNKIHHLPLGGNALDLGELFFDSLNLLYIGTFFNRKLDIVLNAVAAFRNHHKNLNIKLIMIGDGPGNIRNDLQTLAKKLGLESICKFPGFIKHEGLFPYLQQCNIGISFIPMLPAYEFQPPTKTFEYILAGRPVIATKTCANKEVVSEVNGVLCEDTVDSLQRAIETIYLRRTRFVANTIRNSLIKYEWRNLNIKYFLPIINKTSSSKS